VILASSRLASIEGAAGASGPLLVKPRAHTRNGRASAEGVSHFPTTSGAAASAWHDLALKQGGLEFTHLGGTAAGLRPEDRVWLGPP